MSSRCARVIVLSMVGGLAFGCGSKSGLRGGTGGRIGGLGGASSPSETGGVLGTVGVPGTGGVLAIQDAGQDAPLPADAASDPTLQPCGDAACASGQGCVLVGGGPAPRCQPQEDGGTCSFGLVPVSECSGMGASYRPGCTDPPPVPACRTLADACDGACACLCPAGGGAGCYVREGIAYCSMP